MTPRRLTADEFTRASVLARQNHMEQSTIDLVRPVLVDGQRQVQVATASGSSRAWVSEAVAKFMRHVETVERQAVPDGWKVDLVALPPDLWPAVRELEREARARIKKSGD